MNRPPVIDAQPGDLIATYRFGEHYKVTAVNGQAVDIESQATPGFSRTVDINHLRQCFYTITRMPRAA